MTDKELRKLNRVELLELLVDQAAEMDRLRKELEKSQQALQERTVLVKKAGSMAEASLRLNNVFDAADQAAKDYLDNALAQREALLAQTQAECNRMVAKTRADCRQMVENTKLQCEAVLRKVSKAAVQSARREKQK